MLDYGKLIILRLKGNNLQNVYLTMSQHHFLHWYLNYAMRGIENTSELEVHQMRYVITAAICMVATDPDTMHLHEALQQDDREQFIKATTEEPQNHIKRKH